MEINKYEAEALRTILEIYLFQYIRDDDQIDNMEWLKMMTDLWDRINRFVEKAE